MTWKKVSPDLCEFLEQEIQRFACEKKKMFGCPTYFVNNNMFVGVHGEGLFLRLSENDREEILSKFDEVTKFEPMAGRVMREYVVLPESIYTDEEKFNVWFKRSYRFVSSLPYKEPKKKKKSTK